MIHVTYLDNYEEINKEILLATNDLELHQQDDNEGHLIFSNTFFGKQKRIEGVALSNIIVEKNLKLLETEILNFFKNELIITNSWLLKTEPRGYGADHTHGDSYSGVYYLNAKKGQGALKFKFFETGETISVEPRTGNLIIFGPNPIVHEVLTNESNESRFSVAFVLGKK